MAESEKWSLSRLDVKKWGRNALIFFSPLAILYIGFVISNINLDGFAWTDFRPNSIIIGSMMLYVLNTLLDLFRKFAGGPEA